MTMVIIILMAIVIKDACEQWTSVPPKKVFQESKTEYYSMDQKVENIEIFEAK